MKGQLSNRAVLLINGEDSRSFLQSLVTKDINKLEIGSAIYTLLLTPQGKYLFDFFVTATDTGLMLDCKATVKDELMAKLMMYKLRSKVKIEDVSHLYIIALSDTTSQIKQDKARGATPTNEPTSNDVMFKNEVWYDNNDPRYNKMPGRMIIPKTSDLPVLDLEYEATRILHAIPEGDTDLISNKSFPLEFGLDQLNAIDFNKGCYVGQEVTARTTYRGTIRKAIFSISSDQPLHAGDLYDQEKNKVGSMCSFLGVNGIALIRTENLISDIVLTETDQQCTITQPEWRKQ